MKTYKSTNRTQKSKMGKKTWLSIGIGAALVMAALAITLTLVLKPPVDIPSDTDTPIDTTPAFVSPVDNYTVGKVFSKSELVEFISQDGAWTTHEGIDLIAAEGSDVKAIAAGTITSIEYTLMQGNVVVITHADGLVSKYMSLGDDIPVSVNDTVKAGDVIGKVSKSMNIENREYELPHVHLEILKDGVRVNPLTYIPEISDK